MRVVVASRSVVTNSDGTFELVVPSGTQTVRVERDGTDWATTSVYVPSNDIAPIDLALAAPVPGAGPVVSITTPRDHETIASARLRVTGMVRGRASRLEVNGSSASISSDGSFSTMVSLQDGDNTIVAVATDKAGHSNIATVHVSLDGQGGTLSGIVTDVVSAKPLKGATVGCGSTVVQTDEVGAYAVSVPLGEVSCSVKANGYRTRGIAMSVKNSGAWTRNVELLANNAVPMVTIDMPDDGSIAKTGNVEIAGVIRLPRVDTVQVNGVAATVAQDTYRATVPVVQGANTVTVTATNANGLQTYATVSITGADGDEEPQPKPVTTRTKRSVLATHAAQTCGDANLMVAAIALILIAVWRKRR